MLTYTGRRTIFGNLTENNASDNLTFGDTIMNNADRKVLNMANWDFMEGTFTRTTVASQQNYELAQDYKRLVASPYITVSSTRYTMKQAPNRKFWDDLNIVSRTSDIPEWFFIFGRELLIYPAPASSSNTITIPYEKRHIDLTIADYTTGTIVSIANAATTLTGSGTTWTAKMAGRYVRIDDSNTANTGDGQWYKILSRTSDTVIELDWPYQGTTITGGSGTYNIGQVSQLPEDFQMLPVYKAAQIYWAKEGDRSKTISFKELYDELLLELFRTHVYKTTNPAIDDIDYDRINPNLTISLT